MTNLKSKIFRADHCGSLIRPDRLKKARVDYVRGELTKEGLDEVESEAIRNALSLQRSAGLDVYSDGEFRRGSWLAAISDEFFEGMENEGIDFVRYPFLRDRAIGDPEVEVPPNPIVTSKLGLRKRITKREIDFLEQHAPGPYKITIPSPVTLSRAAYKEGVSDKIYPTWTDFFNAYTDLLVTELAAIADDGVPYVQLDAPHYTRFIVPERRSQLTNLGIDLETELRTTIAAENRCLRAAKRDKNVVAVHICLGTFILGPQGPLGGAGEYDEKIISRLLHEIEADIFLIEYSDRAGSLETLRDAPKSKILSLGIVNVRDPRIETSDEIVRKVELAAKYVPVENLSLCPNCGFSGSAADAFVNEDIERRKLGSMVEAAGRIWGRTGGHV